MLARITRPFVVVLLLLVMLAGLYLLLRTTGLTEEKVRQVVLSTIQRESQESFLVTGAIETSTTVTRQSTKALLPKILNIDLGTTESTVRVPGRISYGFDVRELSPEHIVFMDDGTLEITIPPLRVYSAEPVMENMEVETHVGWARAPLRSGRAVERDAIRSIQSEMIEQGAAHIQDAAQPRINTARAIQEMLTPVLEAGGFSSPRFRFRIGDDLVIEPEPGRL